MVSPRALYKIVELIKSPRGVDPELLYIIEEFFVHPQQNRYWPRAARRMAKTICDLLLAREYLVPSAKAFYVKFGEDLEKSTRTYLRVGDRLRFLNTCKAAIGKGWIRALPMERQAMPKKGEFPSDIEAASDLFIKFTPPVLRMDVIGFLSGVAEEVGTRFTHTIDPKKDRPITIRVEREKLAEVQSRLGPGDVFISCVESDHPNEEIQQTAGIWGEVIQESRTTIGAILSWGDRYYALTTAHGFIPPDARKKAMMEYPPFSPEEKAIWERGEYEERGEPVEREKFVLYLPESGLDIALIRVDKALLGNMFNFTSELKGLPCEGSTYTKAGGKTGITAAKLLCISSGGICVPNTGRQYYSALEFDIAKGAPESQSQPGDCGALHCQENSHHEFIPIGIHFGHTSFCQYAVPFAHNITSLCQHFNLPLEEFSFHNIRESSRSHFREMLTHIDLLEGAAEDLRSN
jgi:hypothetical protein